MLKRLWGVAQPETLTLLVGAAGALGVHLVRELRRRLHTPLGEATV